jgi:hypothetical protein
MVYDYLSSVSLRDIHEADKQASSDSSIQAA